MTGTGRGHRVAPHTADIRVEAWAVTREDCLAEAVAALVESVADTSGARPARTVAAERPASTDADRLVAALDEVIYLLDTEDAVPLTVEVDTDPTTLHLRMSVATLRDVEVVGPAPKAVALSGLRLSGDQGRWEAAATIDV